MRTYGQFCALARALDRVGDRWTLLIARELLLGPRRFTDLRSSLPGLATNLLAERLRRLVDDGLAVRRELPPPAPATVYELTDAGRELEPIVFGLIRFGARYMDGPAEGDVFREEWLALAVRGLLHDGAATASADGGEPLTLQLHAGRVALVVAAEDGGVRVEPGEADEPDVTLRGDPRAVLGYLSGRDPDAPVAVEGDRGALERLLAATRPAALA